MKKILIKLYLGLGLRVSVWSDPDLGSYKGFIRNIQ